ncbi:PIR protein [Plasmodium vivax]|uniref:VIR protein n=1 Tax=Plasmodium vivax TaxID=5855 RepID=A0A564ZR79_PLAVI|nr:PIR protein [Plasmodium vivax]
MFIYRWNSWWRTSSYQILVLQDTKDLNPGEERAKEPASGDEGIKTLDRLANSEDGSSISPTSVSGGVENTDVGSDHVKSVTRNVGNASDGVLSTDGKVAITVTPESAASGEKHSVAGSSGDQHIGAGDIHSAATCGETNGKAICKPDGRKATISAKLGTEVCRSETGGSETLVGSSHHSHSPSFLGTLENASYTQEHSMDSPAKAGRLPEGQMAVAEQVLSPEARLSQGGLDGQQLPYQGQHLHSYQGIQSQVSAIPVGVVQTQGNTQEGKFNIKITEDTGETHKTIYNIIEDTISRYIRELPIRTYIIAAFLPFVIFLLWKFLIKYTPLSILVDKKKKKKRKKMNARLERILLDPSYQREKNIPLAYSPYEYYTY